MALLDTFELASGISDLLSVFNQSNTLIGLAFTRIRGLWHEDPTAAHIKQRDPSVLHTLEPGPETSAFVCASCQAPWLQLDCKSKTRRVSKSEGLGITQEVDGVRWTALQDLTKEQEEDMKSRAAINASEFGAPLPQPATPMETSFSDWVPNHQRVTLRAQVVEDENDPALFRTDPADRPPIRTDLKDGQQALFFHPQAAEVLCLRARPPERPSRST